MTQRLVPLRLSQGASGRRGRRAFTLVEMLVSLAVLTVALSVVGVVFSVTTRTATQAAAVAEVQSWVREFTLQIEEDLKYCSPANSVLVLVGRTQAAALTQEDLAAGNYYRVLKGDPTAVAGGYHPEFDPTVDPEYSNPRADILMFFTQRPTASQAPPANPKENTFGEIAASGAKFSPTQIVYGHAALGDTVFSGTEYSWGTGLRHIDRPDGNTQVQSLLPANRWHLARRATIIDHYAGRLKFLPGVWDRILRCYTTDDSFAGDAARLDLPDYLGNESWGFGQPAAVQASPYQFGRWLGFSSGPGLLWNVLYAGGDPINHHVATVLESPPTELRSNLGVHMVPGCAWFEVEFLMPEDPRNSIEYDHPVTTIEYQTRFDMARWTEVAAGQTYVFIPDTAENREQAALYRPADFARLDPTGNDDLANKRIRMWPYALRITVRVFDPRGRLEEPIVRSIVHRFD
ncbi:MAG: prepilin-type N-terminal cleavage/methylation domain-containing protein [Planctomycetes bacterium]|nr:prepilin-type N-terminal cleavage/methylation domain-containing protein [Planctomycetota bacterium]